MGIAPPYSTPPTNRLSLLPNSCLYLTTLFLPFRFFFLSTYASPTAMDPAEFCEGYILASLCELT